MQRSSQHHAAPSMCAETRERAQEARGADSSPAQGMQRSSQHHAAPNMCAETMERAQEAGNQVALAAVVHKASSAAITVLPSQGASASQVLSLALQRQLHAGCWTGWWHKQPLCTRPAAWPS